MSLPKHFIARIVPRWSMITLILINLLEFSDGMTASVGVLRKKEEWNFAGSLLLLTEKQIGAARRVQFKFKSSAILVKPEP